MNSGLQGGMRKWYDRSFFKTNFHVFYAYPSKIVCLSECLGNTSPSLS